MKDLKKRYESICNDYVNAFAEKHEIEFDGWIGDMVGGTASFSDQYFFYISDIVFDVNNECKKGLILQWQEDNVQNDQSINYSSYSKGLRHSDLKK